MKQSRHVVSYLIIFLFILTVQLSAYVKLPKLFSDNMVLQQDIEIPIWGTADPGENIAITLNNQKAYTTADNYGDWITNLKPMKTGGPFDMTITGKNSVITLRNVLIGEVWVGSGQSNMWLPVINSANAEKEIAEANYPNIRLYTIKQTVAGAPQKDTEGEWVECNPKTIPNFSAVAYYFGRELHKALGVPVGLIHSSWGGTPAESWTSLPALKSDPDFKPILDRFEDALKMYPQASEKYQKQIAEWEKEAQKAKSEKKPEPRRPSVPFGPNNPNRPSGLYNGMIAPLIPYAIKGVIWYQGESNAGRAYQYRKLFPALIQDWRRNWGQGDFPFLFVQLAYFREVPTVKGTETWSELREAQLMTLSLPKTAMAVTIDIGEAYDIHPKNKQDVGLRLALGAQAIAYGKNIDYSGPIYDSMTIKGNKINLHFKHINGGLVSKNNEPLKGFTIAGKEQKFLPAEAKIEGNEIVVSSKEIPKPVAVRYAWAADPECNLYNKVGLPASPFRTDNWPGVTMDIR